MPQRNWLITGISSGFSRHLGARTEFPVVLTLTAEELARIKVGADKITVQGGRYGESLDKLVGKKVR